MSVITHTLFRDTDAYRRGDTAQREWAAFCLTHGGGVVIPLYDSTEITPEDKAPMVMMLGEDVIAPDCLYINSQTGKLCWHEVKAKTAPTFRINPPGPRWEHGIDLDAALQYQLLERESKISVLIIVQDPVGWLSITLENVFRTGDERKDWPGGSSEPLRRGRRGKGGLLWPRSAMSWWNYEYGEWCPSNPPEP